MEKDPFRERKEHPSTYIVQDRSNEEELIRLDTQDRMYTKCMGGVLSEQPAATIAKLQRVLDVGCGPGWWLLETARTYPDISLLVGVDVSGRMIDYACAQAEKAGISSRMQFQTGDALRMLEFPNAFFGLVNQRLAMSWLRKWDWGKLLSEYRRVCKPGGVIRITEGAVPESNSPALTRLFDLLFQATNLAGHYFTPEKDGVIRHLAAQMDQYGIEQIQTQTHTIAFHDDPATKQLWIQDVQRAFHTMIPFLRKWLKLPADYENTYQQMLYETQQENFEASVTLLTAWGKNPGSY